MGTTNADELRGLNVFLQGVGVVSDECKKETQAAMDRKKEDAQSNVKPTARFAASAAKLQSAIKVKEAALVARDKVPQEVEKLIEKIQSWFPSSRRQAARGRGTAGSGTARARGRYAR